VPVGRDGEPDDPTIRRAGRFDDPGTASQTHSPALVVAEKERTKGPEVFRKSGDGADADSFRQGGIRGRRHRREVGAKIRRHHERHKVRPPVHSMGWDVKVYARQCSRRMPSKGRVTGPNGQRVPGITRKASLAPAQDQRPST
jgi:hypothetical protein